MIRNYEYFCPECYQQISQEHEVSFNTKRSNGEFVKLYLNPKPGTYNLRTEPSTDFLLGEQVEFFCPHCEQNLESPQYEKFIEIDLKITDKVSISVYFSKIFGEHKTFVGIEDFNEEYGDQIANY